MDTINNHSAILADSMREAILRRRCETIATREAHRICAEVEEATRIPMAEAHDPLCMSLMGAIYRAITDERAAHKAEMEELRAEMTRRVVDYGDCGHRTDALHYIAGSIADPALNARHG